MAAAMVADTEVDTEVDMPGFGGRGGGWGGGHAHIAGDIIAADISTTAFPLRFWGGGFTYNGYGCWRWYPGSMAM